MMRCLQILRKYGKYIWFSFACVEVIRSLNSSMQEKVSFGRESAFMYVWGHRRIN